MIVPSKELLIGANHKDRHQSWPEISPGGFWEYADKSWKEVSSSLLSSVVENNCAKRFFLNGPLGPETRGLFHQSDL